jgi:HK97 family phage major capsid protein
MRSIQLRKDRAKLVADAGALLTSANQENRALTSEEQVRFDKLHADGDDLLKQIEREERQEAAERVAVETQLAERDAGQGGPSADPAENVTLERESFRSFLRAGWGGMPEEHRSHAQRKSRLLADAMKDLPAELRAAQTVTTTGGGYLIPREFQKELDVAMLAFGPMTNPAAVRVLETPTGATLDWPTVNDTAVKGELLAINTQAAQTAFAVGQVSFDAYKFSSKIILVPVELAQDAAFPIDTFLKDALAERIGRILNDYLTTGSGSSQPNGIVTAATASGIAGFDLSELAAGVTSAYTWYLMLVALEHSVDPAYRQGAAFMMHDTMLRDLRKCIDTTGRPIWAPGMTPGAPDTMLGYPFWINQSMSNTGTTTNIPIIFGQLKKYMTRIARPTIMLRLIERYADYLQVGYISFDRADGDLLDAGTHPIKSATVVT